MTGKILMVMGLAAGIAVSAALLPAQETTTTPPAARGPAVPARLEAAMKEMDSLLRAVKAEAADPAKMEQTMKNLATLQRDVAISKLQIPPSLNAATGAEKEKGLATYRTMLTGLMRTLLDLEDAVAAKKVDEIKKLLTKIEEHEKTGHAEFGVGG